MTNVNALKALYAAFGGSSSAVADLKTSSAVIAKLATLVATKPELPSVTSSNNGQILTVSSGKWAVADAPKELPTVSATDNGSVLKVVDGAWAVGADATE